MFPLMHIKLTEKIKGYLSDELIVGSLLPDVLRLTGCDWSKSHQVAKLLVTVAKRCNDIVIGALVHGEDPPGVDYFSDVSFNGTLWGWAFYKAWQYFKRHIYVPVPIGLMPWIFHNMVEAAVDMFLYETLTKEELFHIIEVSSWNVNWEHINVLLIKSSIPIRRDMQRAYQEYISLSVEKYVDHRCFIKSLYEIGRRKFYRHGISTNLPMELYLEVWEDLYSVRANLYTEYIDISLEGIRHTYEEWCQ